MNRHCQEVGDLQISEKIKRVPDTRLTCPFPQFVGGQEPPVAQHPHLEPGEEPVNEAQRRPGRSQGTKPKQRRLHRPQHPFTVRHRVKTEEWTYNHCRSVKKKSSKCKCAPE